MWYYLNAEKQVLGPVLEDELEYLVRQGVLKFDSLICREGTEDWIAYRDAFNVIESTVESLPVEIEFSCIQCGQCITATEEQAGVYSQCPNCGGCIQVPPAQIVQEKIHDIRSSFLNKHNNKTRNQKRIWFASACGMLVFAVVIWAVSHQRGEDNAPIKANQNTEGHATGRATSVAGNPVSQEVSPAAIPPANLLEDQNADDHAAGIASAVPKDLDGFSEREQSKDRLVDRSSKTTASSDLSRWRVSGICLGMSKEKLENTLQDMSGIKLSLEKDFDDPNAYFTKLVDVKVGDRFRAGLASSRFYFDEKNLLRKAVVDLELVVASSNLRYIDTNDLLQQLLKQYGLKKFNTPASLNGERWHNALVQDGENLISIVVLDGECLVIQKLANLTFGPAGTVYGLKLGMSQGEVVTIIKKLFGDDAKLEKIDSRFTDSSDEVTAYFISLNKNSVQDANSGKVVFDGDGRLCVINLDSEQLSKISPCDQYLYFDYVHLFERHFSIEAMTVKKTRDELDPDKFSAIEYVYKKVHENSEFIYSCTYENPGYSIWVEKSDTAKINF